MTARASQPFFGGRPAISADLTDSERKRLDRAVRRALSAEDRAYVIRHADVSLRSTVELYWNSGRPGTCWCSLCAIAIAQVRREYARLSARRKSVFRPKRRKAEVG